MYLIPCSLLFTAVLVATFPLMLATLRNVVYFLVASLLKGSVGPPLPLGVYPTVEGGGPSADVSSSSEAACVPVKTYINADLQKLQVLKENKAKSGIYRWVNLKNGKSYVGSSVNLRRRLINYYSILNLKAEIKRNKSIIYRSLLRYKHYNFSLEILEYCEPSATISREQYYLDMLKPAYNILKTAASSLGFF